MHNYDEGEIQRKKQQLFSKQNTSDIKKKVPC